MNNCRDSLPGSKALNSNTKSALYVTTDLRSLEVELMPGTSEILQDGSVFRLLDNEYILWIGNKIVQVRKAYEKGKVSYSAFNRLIDRYQGIQSWAKTNLGYRKLNAIALRLSPTRNCQSTVSDSARKPARIVSDSHKAVLKQAEHLFPQEGEFSFTFQISHEAVQQVSDIHDNAISQGWTEPQLFQNRGRFRFPCGQDYGLVCFLQDGWKTGKITKQSIELLSPLGNILRFYNLQVDQPWIKKVNTDEKNET